MSNMKNLASKVVNALDQARDCVLWVADNTAQYLFDVGRVEQAERICRKVEELEVLLCDELDAICPVGSSEAVPPRLRLAPEMPERDALAHLRRARDLLKNSPRTLTRVRRAITSCGGAIRHAALRDIRESRREGS